MNEELDELNDMSINKSPLEKNRLKKKVKNQVSVIKEIAKEVQMQVGEATSVLDDLLNYDKIENGSLSLEWSLLPIWDLIERTTHEFSVPAMNKKIRLDVEFESSVAPTFDKHCHNKSDLEQGIQSNASTTIRSASSSDLPRTARKLFVIGDVVRMSQVFRNLLSKCDWY